MLFIEYDVLDNGQIELVALINAVEDDGADAAGEAWITWRQSHDDGGHGCASVPPEDLALMESTEDADELAAIVERLLLADRLTKEKGTP